MPFCVFRQVPYSSGCTSTSVLPRFPGSNVLSYFYYHMHIKLYNDNDNEISLLRHKFIQHYKQNYYNYCVV